MSSNSYVLMKNADPATIALDAIDMSQPDLYEQDIALPFFARLRKEAPFHYCANGQFEPFWSVTRFNDIVEVEKNHQLFSNDPNIALFDPMEEVPFQSFLQMDPPRHDVLRASVQGAVAPANLKNLESLIRERAARILDDLPVGETFDWVDRVSIELTNQMLATLFDFPFEERRKLIYWSDLTADSNGGGGNATREEQAAGMMECAQYLTRLWNERVDNPVGNDFISMMIRSETTRHLVDNPMEYLGMCLLLIVGGNDTTRNSISGGVLALNKHPAEYEKLRQNLALIPGMVSEIIRWQTPIIYMRRRATADTELFGKKVREGDKLLLWYLSGNRDESVIEQPNDFIIDRENPRNHISFGFGVHRCMGNRMAEMQLRIVWEEIMKRFRFVELMEQPTRFRSNMVRGYTEMKVQVHPW